MSPRTTDEDLCLLSDRHLLKLSRPDAAGYLSRRSNIAGWYNYWFSLSGSQLLYFEREKNRKRGPLVGTINLFRCRIGTGGTEEANRVLLVTDGNGKVHHLKAASFSGIEMVGFQVHRGPKLGASP